MTAIENTCNIELGAVSIFQKAIFFRFLPVFKQKYKTKNAVLNYFDCWMTIKKRKSNKFSYFTTDVTVRNL